MKNSFYTILSVLALCMFLACNTNSKMIGLWQIEKVSVGDMEMTPTAKWTRLNEDRSQSSGNGWHQHTVGSWNYDNKSRQIKLVSENGLKDEFGAFTVLEQDQKNMKWTREEEGEEVQIFLKKITKLPQAPFNTLLGVWKLQSDNKNAISYLFFRWDQIAIHKKENQNKIYGMYKTHGHKNELQIIYYETPLRQEVWTYSFKDNDILLLENTSKEKPVKEVYERIDYIPQ